MILTKTCDKFLSAIHNYWLLIYKLFGYLLINLMYRNIEWKAWVTRWVREGAQNVSIRCMLCLVDVFRVGKDCMEWWAAQESGVSLIRLKYEGTEFILVASIFFVDTGPIVFRYFRQVLKFFRIGLHDYFFQAMIHHVWFHISLIPLRQWVRASFTKPTHSKGSA